MSTDAEHGLRLPDGETVSAEALRELVNALYHGRRLSQSQVAAAINERFGTALTQQTVSALFRRLGIGARDLSAAMRIARTGTRWGEEYRAAHSERMKRMAAGGRDLTAQLRTRQAIKKRAKSQSVWETRPCMGPGCTATVTRKPHRFRLYPHAFCSCRCSRRYALQAKEEARLRAEAEALFGAVRESST